MEIALIRPNEGHKKAVWDYRAEFAGAQVDGSAALHNAESFEGWLAAVRANSREQTVAEGLVPSDTMLGIRQSDGVLVGFIDIRHRLNDFLLQFGGHIGYSVRPAERRKGYATAMLTLALERCRVLGLERVLITCDKTNTASSATIVKCGGVFEDERPHGEGVTQRYWITL